MTWAHPKYGNVLATCGQDSKVKVWHLKEDGWKLAFETDVGASVHCISWAPWEYGAVLAAGSENGMITVIRREGDTWATWNVI